MSDMTHPRGQTQGAWRHTADTGVPPLPQPARMWGPVTSNRLARLFAGYFAVAAIGTGLLHAPLSDGWHILGLGLMWPGGGFLAHADLCTTAGIGHLFMALSAAALFGLSVFIWFATGNIVAPPLTWLGTALWAAAMAHGPLSPQIASVAHAAGSIAWLPPLLAWPAWRALAHRRRREDNRYLRHMAPRLHEVFTTKGGPARPPEMSLSHVQRLRFALDRALQPIADFDGFEHRDPFQTAALRYQVNFLAYGLALTQARFTPAFRGYMTQAQQQMLQKQRQHRIWSYWALENLWGNLRLDPDPIQRDNIMFTGFVALQMALFEASTGSRDASRPGFFTLEHPAGTQYAHDHASLIRQLDGAFRQSPFGLVPCEPNWIYPLCNTMGACAILAHGTQCGSTIWQDRHAAAFRQHLEAEFLDPFGRLVPCRSSATGLALPAIGGVMPQAMPCYFLNALAPDLARRQWLLLRRHLFDEQGRFQPKAFWPIDTGNYGFSRASAYTATALAARELGDEAVYHHCMAALASECPGTLQDGVIHRAKASVWSHGVELMALAGGADAFRTLIHTRPTHEGPWLEHVPYPDILVASAHADSAGSLQAVLYGARDDEAHTLIIGGLRPSALYRVEGAACSHIVAGRHGRAKLRVKLTGRTCLRVDLAWQVSP